MDARVEQLERENERLRAFVSAQVDNCPECSGQDQPYFNHEYGRYETCCVCADARTALSKARGR